MHKWLLMIPALIAGSLIPIQSGINAKLSGQMVHPLQATFVSFLMGLLLVSVILLFLRPTMPANSTWGQLPWYLYTGGMLGVVFVTAALMLVPRIGIANFVVAALTGQMVVSMVLDHFGAFGVPVHPIQWPRLVGVVLLAVGVILVQK